MRPRLRPVMRNLIVQVSYLLRVIVDLRHAGANRDDLFILISAECLEWAVLNWFTSPFRFY